MSMPSYVGDRLDLMVTCLLESPSMRSIRRVSLEDSKAGSVELSVLGFLKMVLSLGSVTY